jgi:serine/threonine-protein kinase
VTKTLETPVLKITKGTLIAGKYRILEEIGRGGMGIVYRAEDIKLKRTVALKFLPHQWTADAAARERLIHEAQAASALDHPNICTIYEIEETEDGRMYISMAFYEGESLRDRIKREPLKAEEAVDIAIQIAQGMANAHQAGIVHRDIKPANILLTKAGAAKIVDFGLAKLADQVKLTREGTTIGTVAYMSPEQARGDAVDQRTDIWSLGVVLYEMLSGKLPFKGDHEQSLIHSILKTDPEPITKFRKDLPAGLAQIIAKTLAKNPAARYPTMNELVEDLKAVAEGLKPLRARAGFLRGRILGIRKIYAYSGLAAFIILAALTLLFLFPKRGQAYGSLAILPLENLSHDSEQDILCDEVQRQLINLLYQIHSIKKVTAKSSTMTYKGSQKKCSEIATELGVSVIVKGDVRRTGNTVRINFEIVDGQNDALIIGGSVEEEYRDMRTLQNEAALEIANRIQARLMPEESKLLGRKKQVNPDAYDAYLTAMKFVNMAPQKEMENCFPYFEKALKIDPNFAEAYAGLATVYDFQYAFLCLPSKDVIPKSIEAAKKALDLDDSQVDAQCELMGWAWYPDYDYDGQIKQARRFVEKYPNHAFGHALLANFLALTGRGPKEEAIQHAEIAQSLNPREYSMLFYLAQGTYWPLHEYDTAILLIKEMLDLFPKDPVSHYMLQFYYLHKGMYKEAWAELQNAIDLGYELISLPLQYAFYYAASGDQIKARKFLNDHLAQSKDIQRLHSNDSMDIASIYALLGEKDKAFEWLNIEYEDRTSGGWFIKTDPFLNNLRGDPRYTDLLKKMHFD